MVFSEDKLIQHIKDHAKDPNNQDVFKKLISELFKSPMRAKIEPLITSSVAHSYYLEGDFEKSITSLNEYLKFRANQPNSIEEQCDIMHDLANIHHIMGSFGESIRLHRQLINIAMKESLFKQVANSLNALGHLHTELNNLNAALTSHGRSLELMRELGEPVIKQFKSIMSISHIHALLEDYKVSLNKIGEAEDMIREDNEIGGQDKLAMSKKELLICKIELLFERAFVAERTQSFNEARIHYENVKELLDGCNDIEFASLKSIWEPRIYAKSGHICRLEGKSEECKVWFEKRLSLIKNPTGDYKPNIIDRSEAITDLAFAYQHCDELDKSRELLIENLDLVGSSPCNTRSLKLLLASSYSYLGENCYLLNFDVDARENLRKSLELFKCLEGCEKDVESIERGLSVMFPGSTPNGESQIGLRATETPGPALISTTEVSACPSTKTSTSNSMSTSTNDIDNNNLNLNKDDPFFKH